MKVNKWHQLERLVVSGPVEQSDLHTVKLVCDVQQADRQAVLLFDASDSKKARLAIRLVGAKRKRTLTAEQRAAKVAILERARIARMAVVQVS